jgi:hypothetical protein
VTVPSCGPKMVCTRTIGADVRPNWRGARPSVTIEGGGKPPGRRAAAGVIPRLRSAHILHAADFLMTSRRIVNPAQIELRRNAGRNR